VLSFLIILAIPTIIALFVTLYFKGTVTWAEFALQVGVAAVIACIGLTISYKSRVHDTELWNGMVSSRNPVHVSCSHSYSCNCRTTTSGSGKNSSTSTTCDTCYEHSFDQDWRVSATTGETIDIDRIDRQGLLMPPRWAAAYKGEPFSSQHTFSNYILANPGSVLLGGQGDISRFPGLIPTYPAIYDVYHTHHFILQGTFDGFDRKDWDYLVEEINKDLGPVKQVNVIVLVVKTADPSYLYALRTAWVGGKKNDAVIVIGSLDGHRIEWVDVMSWTTSESYKVLVRDALTQVGTLDQRDAIANNIRTITKSDFERLHMKKMQYLMSSSEMPGGQIALLILLVSIIELGLAWWCVNNDITDSN